MLLKWRPAICKRRQINALEASLPTTPQGRALPLSLSAAGGLLGDGAAPRQGERAALLHRRGRGRQQAPAAPTHEPSLDGSGGRTRRGCGGLGERLIRGVRASTRRATRPVRRAAARAAAVHRLARDGGAGSLLRAAGGDALEIL